MKAEVKITISSKLLTLYFLSLRFSNHRNGQMSWRCFPYCQGITIWKGHDQMTDEVAGFTSNAKTRLYFRILWPWLDEFWVFLTPPPMLHIIIFLTFIYWQNSINTQRVGVSSLSPTSEPLLCKLKDMQKMLYF